MEKFDETCHANSEGAPSSDLRYKDREVDWLELPDCLLSLITGKLIHTRDFVRFGSVCRSWQCIYLERKDHRPHEPLLLMFPTQLNDVHQICNFYSLTEERVLDIQSCLPHERFCAGSSHGWLIIVSASYEVRLLNPFLNNEIQLPCLTAFALDQGERVTDFDYMHKAALSANPMSSPDYTVMGIYGGLCRLAFFKPGNKVWTSLPSEYRPIIDVIYLKDEFYALHDNGQVIACDVNGPCPTGTKIVEPNYAIGTKYLVESMEELFLIVRHTDIVYVEDILNYSTQGFSAYKLDTSTRRWVEVQSLGGRLYFIGDSSSISLSTAEMPGCKPDCIYFTDDFHEGYLQRQYDLVPHDIGVFNLETKSLEPFFSLEHKVLAPAPIWIKPTWQHMDVDQAAWKELSQSCNSVLEFMIN